MDGTARRSSACSLCLLLVESVNLITGRSLAPVLRAGKETINALYEIDLEHNQGVAFQYEEVVRDKNKRRQMHAVDCECCRDVSIPFHYAHMLSS